MMLITNLLRDPKPARAATFRNIFPNDIGLSITSGEEKSVLLVSTSSKTDKYIGCGDFTLPAGDCVYAAHIVCEEIGLNALRVICTNPTKEFWLTTKRYEGDYAVHFHLDTTRDLGLRIMAPNGEGKTADYRRVMLCTEADWQHIQDLYESGQISHPYFDGDTKPK